MTVSRKDPSPLNITLLSAIDSGSLLAFLIKHTKHILKPLFNEQNKRVSWLESVYNYHIDWGIKLQNIEMGAI